MKICVFGAASEKIDKKYLDDTFALGKLLAERGHDLVFGAGGEGVMGAAARGFKSGGAHIHGVIPQFFEDNGYEGIFKQADVVTKTQTMAERKRTMEDDADAFVILPGGIGTFEELFEVMTLKQLGRHKKPIVIYNMYGFYDWIKDVFGKIVEGGFLNAETLKLFFVAASGDEIAGYIENYNTDDVKWNILKKSDRK